MNWPFFSKKERGGTTKSVCVNGNLVVTPISKRPVVASVSSSWQKDRDLILQQGAERFSKDFGDTMQQLANE